MLQLEILGNGLYDGSIEIIEKFVSREAYSATTDDVMLATKVLNSSLSISSKKELKRLKKYMSLIEGTIMINDPSDEFIHENRLERSMEQSSEPAVPSAPPESIIESIYPTEELNGIL